MCLTHPVVPQVMYRLVVQQALTHHAVRTDLVRLAVQLARLLRHMVLTDHTAHSVRRLTVAHVAQCHTALVAQPVTENGWTSDNKSLTEVPDRLRLTPRCSEYF